MTPDKIAVILQFDCVRNDLIKSLLRATRAAQLAKKTTLRGDHNLTDTLKCRRAPRIIGFEREI